MKRLITIALLATTSACATSPDKIAPTRISTARYANTDCTNLSAQLEDAAAQEAALRNRIQKRNKSDKIMVGVGAIVAWPALFFIKGNGEVKDEYARTQGERVALERAIAERGCTTETAAR